MRLADDRRRRSLYIDGEGEDVAYIKKKTILGEKICPVKEIWIRHQTFRKTELRYPQFPIIKEVK